MINFTKGDYPASRVNVFHETLLKRLEQIPGITHAATSDGLPLYDQGCHFIFEVEGNDRIATDGFDSYSTWASPAYFETLGVPLLRGRCFCEADLQRKKQPVVIVNRSLAQQLWPDQTPIGQRLKRKGGGFLRDHWSCRRRMLSHQPAHRQIGGVPQDLFLPL